MGIEPVMVPKRVKTVMFKSKLRRKKIGTYANKKFECAPFQAYCYQKSLKDVQKHLRKEKGDVDVNPIGCYRRRALMKTIQVGWRGIEKDIKNLVEKMTNVLKSLLNAKCLVKNFWIELNILFTVSL